MDFPKQAFGPWLVQICDEQRLQHIIHPSGQAPLYQKAATPEAPYSSPSPSRTELCAAWAPGLCSFMLTKGGDMVWHKSMATSQQLAPMPDLSHSIPPGVTPAPANRDAGEFAWPSTREGEDPQAQDFCPDPTHPLHSPFMNPSSHVNPPLLPAPHFW